ncbi:MAG: MmcB family DNA repair protein [Pseudomonadota bacterium]
MEQAEPIPAILTNDGRQSAAAAAIQRGVQRTLRELGFASLCELSLPNGRRADIVALGPKSEIWIVEIKSCREDFQVDQKWPEYLGFCDTFFFAVDQDFPAELIPSECGLMLADRFAGEIMRQVSPMPLAAARRKAMVARFARSAALRLQTLTDPGNDLRQGMGSGAARLL